MNLRPRPLASGSRVMKAKLGQPLKKPKEKPGARLNRGLVKSGGLVEKNNSESELYQDPGPSNDRRRSRRGIVSRTPVSNGNSLELDRQCVVAVKRLTPVEIEEMKQSLRKRPGNGRNQSQTEKKPKLCLTAPPPPRQQSSGQTPRRSRATTTKKDEASALPRRSARIAKRQMPLTVENSSRPEPTASMTPLSPSSAMETGSGSSGIMQLPEEVLHHILDFLTFVDVKSTRLVNKHWRKVATTPLRRSSKQIRLDDSVFKCIAKMGDGQFPVNRLEVQLYDDPEKSKGRSSYFPAICSWVKELTLIMDMDISSYNIWSRLDMSTFPRDCTYQDLTKFNLQLSERTARTPKFWEGFKDFVQSTLKNSPNLQEVTVKYLNYNSQELPTTPVIEDIFPSPDSVGTSKLSYINFEDVPLQKINLAKWFTLNLKLRKLGINLSQSSDYNDLVAKLLETQTGTLKELTLNLNRCDSTRPAATFSFPRMEKLEQLGFTSRCVFVTLVTFPGIDYVTMFPCLKKLDLQQYGIDWKDFIGNNLLEPTNTVEELIFPSSFSKGADPKPCPVAIAARIFPGLRKLEIQANPAVTAAVCEHMPNLEVLTVIGCCKQLDDLITGLTLEVCEKFKSVMTKTWIQKLKTTERRSMARLQSLRTLKMYNFNGELICFSRLSFHVLKKMSSLKYLDLFDGRAVEGHFADKDKKQLLKELRASFVVL